MSIAITPGTPSADAAPAGGAEAQPVRAAGLVAVGILLLVSLVSGRDGCERHHLGRDAARHGVAAIPIAAGRAGRHLVRARRRGQHRPRGHDGARCAGAPVTSATSTASRPACRCDGARRAGGCRARPGHRRSSGSTTSSPVWRSTSSRSAWRHTWPRRCSPTCPDGGPTQSPPFENPPTITIDGIADPAKDLQDKHWFVISDVASMVAALTTRTLGAHADRPGSGRRHLVGAVADRLRTADPLGR